MITFIATTGIIFAFFLVLNVLTFRFLKPQAPVRTMALYFMACLPLIFVVYPRVAQFELDRFISLRDQTRLSALLIFTFLCYISIQAYSVVEASITVRILVHIFRSPNESITMKQLQDLYPFAKLIEGKVDLMVRDNLLAEDRGTGGDRVFVITPKGTLLGSTFSRIKLFLNWGNGG